MRSRSGRTRNNWWGQGLAHHLRMGFDLEVLEPRLLMAASPAARWGSSVELSSPVTQPSSWIHSETSWTGPSPGPGGDTGGRASVWGVPVLTGETLAPPTDDSYLIVDENLSLQDFFGAFFEGVGKPKPPVIDQEHPMLPDAAITWGRGNNLFFDTDPAETAMLNYRKNDVLRTIKDEIVPQYKGA